MLGPHKVHRVDRIVPHKEVRRVVHRVGHILHHQDQVRVTVDRPHLQALVEVTPVEVPVGVLVEKNKCK